MSTPSTTTTNTPAADTSARGIRSTASHATAKRPGRLAVGITRIGHEVRGYFRTPDAVFFTFLFPIIMLTLFSVAFDSAPDIQAGPGVSVDYATY